MGCTNNFTTEADFLPEDNFTDYPPYLCDPNSLTGYSDLGTRVMDIMLLTQYENSPNLKEYIGAYIKEMDLLLEEIHKVELGRYIANATGAQLDVIGVILQQSRNINIPTVWFGFVGASPIDGMADEAVPAAGGIFRSENEEGFTLTPLGDVTYRKVLLCRAYVLNQGVFSINKIYQAVEILLGKTPSFIKLVEISERVWTLELSSSTTTSADRGLLLAVAHWFIPMTITFNISLV